jgi:hypothetical protein
VDNMSYEVRQLFFRAVKGMMCILISCIGYSTAYVSVPKKDYIKKLGFKYTTLVSRICYLQNHRKIWICTNQKSSGS